MCSHYRTRRKRYSRKKRKNGQLKKRRGGLGSWGKLKRKQQLRSY
jgi:hypothetical protein